MSRSNSGKKKKKKISLSGGWPRHNNFTKKKKIDFFPKQNTLFCSEFYTDSNHVTIFSENSSVKKWLVFSRKTKQYGLVFFR
jgi:hypothetical protein